MRIVTLNLWGRSGPWKARLRLAQQQLATLAPDVLCLQEIDERDALRGLARATGLEIAVADLEVSCLAILVKPGASMWFTGMRDALPASDASGGEEARERGASGASGGSGARDASGASGGKSEARERGAVAVNAVHRLQVPPSTELLELRARSPFEERPRRLCAVHLDGVTVANTHLSWRAEDSASRHAQATEIAAHLPSRTVLCGDFNCELTAPEFAPLRARFSDLLAGLPAEREPTWDNRNPHTAPYRDSYPDMRIDLILGDREVVRRHPARYAALVCNTPDSSGLYASDHFGVQVDLRP